VEDAVILLGELRHFPFVATDFALVLSAIEISLLFRIPYWDSAIVAAAQALEARILYSEDLSHNQRYGSVLVVNPFIE
jgi:predicted nucleic acid-binding protein